MVESGCLYAAPDSLFSHNGAGVAQANKNNKQRVRQMKKKKITTVPLYTYKLLNSQSTTNT